MLGLSELKWFTLRKLLELLEISKLLSLIVQFLAPVWLQYAHKDN